MKSRNPIVDALQRLRKIVLPVIKKEMLLRGGRALESYYQSYFRLQDRPQRAKSGNLYFKESNPSEEARSLYGNLLRATVEGGKGNITNVAIENGKVVLRSGIDTNTTVNAGNKTTSLLYARFIEEGTASMKAKPFLSTGFADFTKEELPDIMDDISSQLAKAFAGGA